MTLPNDLETELSNSDAAALLHRRLPVRDKQIKLLHLAAATSFDEPICCELQVVDLAADFPRYVGISYTWGTEAPDRIIYCGDANMPVTASCEDVLRVMRAKGENKLWIDQVCIDQQNREERSSQVALMAETYAHAAAVFVWLGQLVLSDDLARGSLDRSFKDMDTAKQVLQAGQQRMLDPLKENDGDRSSIDYNNLLHIVLPTKGGEIFSPEKIRDVVIDKKEVEKITDELLVFINIFERPYFERRWIIQEVTGHEDVTVLIGDVELSLNVLFDAALYLRSFYSAVLEPTWFDPLKERMGSRFMGRLQKMDLWMRTVNVDLMTRIRASKISGRDLVWHTIHGSTFFRTKDPRDSLYSLRAVWGLKDPPQPDYSLEFDSVAVAYTQWLFEQGYVAMMLGYAPLCRLSHPQLPSWCIDFSCAFDIMVDKTVRQDLSYRLDKLYTYLSETATPGMRDFEGTPTYYKPDGRRVEPTELFPDGAKGMSASFEVGHAEQPELKSNTITLDVITDMLPKDTALDLTKYESVWEWYTSKASRQTDQVKRRIDEQRWWTESAIYGGLFEHSALFKEQVLYHVSGWSKAGQKRPPKYQDDKLFLPDDFVPDEGFLTFWDYSTAKPRYTLLGELMFGMTQEGWPVLLPVEAEVGDTITFICGVGVPFVLRATANAKYQVVGQAHVMSLMWWWNEIPGVIKEKGIRELVLV